LTPRRSDFQQALLAWYRQQRRDLPWRQSSDPYAIWVSEVMLQQTTVAVVVPYFERWMARFPTIEALAQANEGDVLSHWQGLGYYRRARNLHEGARQMASRGIPGDAFGWREVPGVGDYTAGAVASIAFGENVPVVDGNVERVYSRITADGESGNRLRRAAWRWAADFLPVGESADWNQALMELGATICRPKSPQCDACPVSEFCESAVSDRVSEFPRRKPRKEWRQVSQFAVLWRDHDLIGLRRSGEGEWWTGLWVLPRSEFDSKREVLATVRHVVTVHKITLNLVRGIGEPPADVMWHRLADLTSIPMPSPDRRILAKVNIL